MCDPLLAAARDPRRAIHTSGIVAVSLGESCNDESVEVRALASPRRLTDANQPRPWARLDLHPAPPHRDGFGTGLDRFLTFHGLDLG